MWYIKRWKNTTCYILGWWTYEIEDRYDLLTDSLATEKKLLIARLMECGGLKRYWGMHGQYCLWYYFT